MPADRRRPVARSVHRRLIVPEPRAPQMTPEASRLLSLVESLGDNGEPDRYLESVCGERPSLFRWVAAPIEAATALVERLPARDGYRFEDLEPAAPGMVFDRRLGMRFHSAMRSVERGGSFEFVDDESTRRRRHALEKARFDAEIDAFAERLAGERFRLYVVKVNAGFAPDALAALDAALARQSGGDHVLVSVRADGQAVSLSWSSDTHVAATLPELAPYARPEAFDADGWSALFERLAGEPRLRDVLAALPLPTFEGWDASASPERKEEFLYGMLRPVRDFDVLHALLDELGDVDAGYRRHVGGTILDAIRRGAADVAEDDAALAEDFDNRYARLLALHSNVDVEAARTFNASGEALYRRFGRSLVRFARIDSSLENARGLLAYFASIDRSVVTVSPMSDASFSSVSLPEGAAPERVITAGSPRPTLLEIGLSTPRERRFRRLSELDDTDAAEGRWIEPRHEDTIGRIHFHVLNDACITWQPSSVVFRERGEWRYATATADMYHHSRVAGRVGLGRGKSRVPGAYFLPRFGPPENHYHTLVDKLPTLFGYRLLGLDCPLIAAYRPNETMYHMMDLLGIERERVKVDMWSDVVAERAIVPTPARLRALFIDFCEALPKGRSPFGPRIYIARGDASGRGMENEPEVEASLARRGFDIVRMEEHDFEAQIAIAANAEVIVAPHGAGMTNMIFAARGCRIVELIPERYMVRFFWQLAVDCGHRYGVLVGKMSDAGEAGGSTGKTLRWRTDVDALERLVEDIGCTDARRAA